MTDARANFEILLRDLSGNIVPGSVRSGHNVMTSSGIDLLAQLVAWSTVDSVDVPFTQRRARYIGVGAGIQIEDRDVVSLVSPLQVTAGVYLKTLSASLNVFPIVTSATLKAVFSPTEVTYSLPAVTVSEAGLFFDCSPGGVLSLSSPSNAPAFYKTFEPLVKLNSFSMEVTWELRF